MSVKLVFVHGWATDSRVWEGAAAALSGYGEICLVNLPGHGGSGSWTEPTLTPAIREIAAHVEVEAEGAKGDAIGIGWSLGAEALIAYAAVHQDVFKAVVLAGATPCFAANDGFVHGAPRALVRRMIMDMKTDPATALARFYALNFTPEEAALPESVAFIKRYRYPGPIDCSGSIPGCCPVFKYDELTTALEALYKTDLTETLQSINAPTLIVHGARDAVVPLKAAEYLAANIRGSRMSVFKEAGHAPFLTEGARFAGVIKGFLDSL